METLLLTPHPRVFDRLPMQPAVTNARVASLLGLPVGPVLPRLRPFHYAKRALVTSGIAMCRISSRLPSAARRQALRSGYDSLGTPLSSPLHFFRPQTADRSFVKPRQKAQRHHKRHPTGVQILFREHVVNANS
jgi:hypothetical protein